MISEEEFNLILKEKGIQVPDDLRDSFRELVDMQADVLLESWIESRKTVV